MEHKDIIERFASCEDFYSTDFKRGEDDVDFTIGENNAQWPADAQKLRKGRPMLQENRMLPFVNQVINQIRQARPTAVVKPVDGSADIKTAEVLRGLIKNIEVTSNADVVYDTAARNSVMSGIGWIRIVTDYADYNTFDQEVRIERIQNFKGAMLDPSHQKLDGSDAEFGFVYEDMDKEDFKRQYPKAAVEGFGGEGWIADKSIRIADFYYKDYEEKELVEYRINVFGQTEVKTSYREDMPVNAEEIRSRKTHICKVKYAKITGGDILEEGEFPGHYIPIIPVYGFEVYLNNKRSFFSLIHQAKDPQRMLNYWKSASTEVLTLQPKVPYIGAVGQFSTYSSQWADSSSTNYPYLEYDMVVDPETGVPAPAPTRQQPPVASQGMMQEAAMTVDAIKGSLGMYDASLGAQTNDISGKAVISRQMAGDNATFHFVDNLSIAIRQVGRVLVDIIPIIYSNERIIRILGEDGEEQMIPINQNVRKTKDGYERTNEKPDAFFDFNGKYDVIVEVGPSYNTRRQELANTIVEIARVNPDIWAVAGDLFMKALDFPMAEELAKRVRATMDPALLGDDIEAQRLQQMTQAVNEMQQKLQLTEQALLAKKNNQEFENQLEAKKVENDTKKLMIDAAKAEAEIAKIMSETRGDNADALNSVIEVINELRAKTDDVSNALDLLLSSEDEATGEPMESLEPGETLKED